MLAPPERNGTLIQCPCHGGGIRPKGRFFSESDWLACNDLYLLRTYLSNTVSERQYSLFEVACWRRRCGNSMHSSLREALEFTERYADGQATEEEQEAAWNACYGKGGVFGYHDDEAGREAERRLLHEILGNPFRPVKLSPGWLAGNGRCVPLLAQAIYDERRFQDLPILGDALEDAGCTEKAIFSHCRQPGEHVRGCWVLDLLLGKK
jgi:hypothetical protein